MTTVAETTTTRTTTTVESTTGSVDESTLYIYALTAPSRLLSYFVRSLMTADVLTTTVETTTWGDTTTVADTTTIATTTPVETTTGERVCFVTVCLFTHYTTVSFSSIIIIFMFMKLLQK